MGQYGPPAVASSLPRVRPEALETCSGIAGVAILERIRVAATRPTTLSEGAIPPVIRSLAAPINIAPLASGSITAVGVRMVAGGAK